MKDDSRITAIELKLFRVYFSVPTMVEAALLKEEQLRDVLAGIGTIRSFVFLFVVVADIDEIQATELDQELARKLRDAGFQGESRIYSLKSLKNSFSL